MGRSAQMWGVNTRCILWFTALAALAVEVAASGGSGQCGGKGSGPPDPAIENKYAGSKVILLNSTLNFTKRVLHKNDAVLVEFFAPWCGHCKQLAPEIRSVAARLAPYSVKVAAVNCDNAGQACTMMGASSFPTIKMFTAPREKNPYREGDFIRDATLFTPSTGPDGGRTATALADFALAELAKAAASPTSGKPNSPSSSSGPAVIDLGDLSADSDADAATIKAFLSDPATQDKARAIMVTSRPQASSETSLATKRHKQPSHLYTAVARRLAPTSAVSFATMSVPAEEGDAEGQLTDAVASLFPSSPIPPPVLAALPLLIVFPPSVDADGDKIEHGSPAGSTSGPAIPTAPEVYNFAYESMLSFVARMAGLDADGTSQRPAPLGDGSSGTVHAVTSNFASIFKRRTASGRKARPALVEFYAPWCGHCKQLAPVWEEASRRLAGKVTLVAVDATAETALASSHDVSGYPTIKVFRPKSGDDVAPTIEDEAEDAPDDWDEDEDGVWSPPMIPNPKFSTGDPKALSTYSGGRTADDLVEYGLSLLRDAGEDSVDSNDHSSSGSSSSGNDDDDEEIDLNAEMGREGGKGAAGGDGSTKDNAADDKGEDEEAVPDASYVVKANDDNFQSIVTGPEAGLTLVSFTAPWCGHCKTLKPEFATAARRLSGRVRLVQVDATANSKTSNMFAVSAYPTLYVIDGDKNAAAKAKVAAAMEAAGVSDPSELDDPDAVKPDDWDDEDDGEWSPPKLDTKQLEGVPHELYEGPRDAEGMVAAMSERFASARGILTATSAEQLDTVCLQQSGLCAIIMLNLKPMVDRFPDGATAPEDREVAVAEAAKYAAMLPDIAVRNKDKPYSFAVVDGTKQQAAIAAFGMLSDENDLPQLVVINAKKMVFSRFIGTFNPKRVTTFLSNILNRRGNIETMSELPLFGF